MFFRQVGSFKRSLLTKTNKQKQKRRKVLGLKVLLFSSLRSTEVAREVLEMGVQNGAQEPAAQIGTDLCSRWGEHTGIRELSWRSLTPCADHVKLGRCTSNPVLNQDFEINCPTVFCAW